MRLGGRVQPGQRGPAAGPGGPRAGSTATWLMALRSMVRPPSPTEAPAKLCAPPRTDISSPASCANRTAAATSPGPAQRAITAG